MISRHFWILRRLLRKVWVRVAAFAVLAVITVLVARLLERYIPSDLSTRIGADSVEQILGILVSSMLAVTTFSLSIAVSAFAAAASSATPRATALLQEDPTTQNVLATFLGAFLFALVGMIALNAGLFEASGQVVLFLAAIAVVLLVVVALIRWIGHLMSFGRMSDTLDRVEKATTEALRVRLDNPYLGGIPLFAEAPPETVAIRIRETGFIEHIDIAALQTCAETFDGQIYLQRLPGSFVHRGEVLARVCPAPGDAHADAIHAAFTVGRQRSYDDDPRFGLVVLGEIASRALSPAVNDPGTAIAVVGRLGRILGEWRAPVEPDIRFGRVHVPPIQVADALEDGFRPIARDGAGLIEVQIRLQKTLKALAELAPDVFAGAIEPMAASAIERARAAGMDPQELAQLVEAARRDSSLPSQTAASL
jgi:uncharacterized membrane protein